jgi:hypothetical protein
VEFKLNALEYQANADDSYLTAKWLKENLPEKTIIATYMVGAYGYYTDLYFIDLLGLTDPVIAKSKGFSQGWIGHESYNIDYVLRKKPDMFILGSGKLAHNIPLEKASLMPPEVDKEAFCTEYDMKSLNLSSNKNRPKYLNCWVRRDSPIISY